jgi:hypothetical protein
MSSHDDDDDRFACKVCRSTTKNASFHQLHADNALDIDNIHDIDSSGNQAAHIAAQLNHVDCFKVLIQHDARMGKKNFEGKLLLLLLSIDCSGRISDPMKRSILLFVGLTPLGVAQMNGNEEIVNLIKDNYMIDDSLSNRDWDEEFNSDGWVEVWSAERQKPEWERRLPDGQVETSTTPPPVDYQLVLKARQRCSQPVVRRIAPNSSVMMFERQRRIQQKRLDLVLKERQQLVQERCVIKLQALFRQRKARQASLHLRAQTIAANRIKRRLNGRRQQKRELACIKIQSFFRMNAARVYYKEFLHERLSSYRASRILACCVQRLWRGFKGRSNFRRHLEITTLPNPADHEFWVQLQIEAGPAKRELGVYAEYILSGNPKTWRDRNLIKRHGKYYRDVSFYANTITRTASWTKPRGWVFKDAKEYYALRVQTFWRARVAKRKINLLVKANKLLTNKVNLQGPTPKYEGRSCN